MTEDIHIKVTLDNFLDFLEKQPDNKRIRLICHESQGWHTVRYSYEVPLFRDVVNHLRVYPRLIRGMRYENIHYMLQRTYKNKKYHFHNTIDEGSSHIFNQLQNVLQNLLFEHKYTRIEYLTYKDIKQALREAVKRIYDTKYDEALITA